MLLGAHVTTAGGMLRAVDEGLALGCEAIQVFTRNQRQWAPKPLDPAAAAAFRKAARAAGYLATAVSHASYLINLSAHDPDTLERSRRAFVDEIERCAALGIPYLCLHPGSHLGAGEDAGLAAVAASLREALAATRGRRVAVLLENTAGQGTNLGWDLDHLVRLLDLCRSKRVGVCIDTCHLFAAGYDLRTKPGRARTLDLLADTFGDRIRAFHLNDSVHPRGSRKDRHAHVGEGAIGRPFFRDLVNDPRFRDRPGLLETPGGAEGYGKNLDRLRKMRAT